MKHLLYLFLLLFLSFPLSANQPSSVDTDSDGVPDVYDNCTLEPNGTAVPDAGGNSQLDTDDDGYGNICDGDYDNSGIVDYRDMAEFQEAFGTENANVDLDGNGLVNFADTAKFRQLFGFPPGPAGVLQTGEGDSP